MLLADFPRLARSLHPPPNAPGSSTCSSARPPAQHRNEPLSTTSAPTRTSPRALRCTWGTGLPELHAPRFVRHRARGSAREIPRQIEADGGHAERSLHYHRYTHDFYLLALLVAGLGETRQRLVREAVGRMAVFMRAVTDDTGHIPRIGTTTAGALSYHGTRIADVRVRWRCPRGPRPARPDEWGMRGDFLARLAWTIALRLTAPPPPTTAAANRRLTHGVSEHRYVAYARRPRRHLVSTPFRTLSDCGHRTRTGSP